MWVTLASDTKIFFTPLQYNSTVKSAPQKYFLNFLMSCLTVGYSHTKLCVNFSIGDTVGIDMKEIGCRHSSSRDL